MVEGGGGQRPGLTADGDAPVARAPIPLFERLQIESQAHCNRACWFCPRTFDRSGKYLDGTGRAVAGQMPTETILGILDQARALGFGGEVGFHHYSEPLLDRRNVMLAREGKRRGMVSCLHTNGDVLRHDDQLCRDVMEVYERIVVGVYDYTTDAELAEATRFWQRRLAGARLAFSPIGWTRLARAHEANCPAAAPQLHRIGSTAASRAAPAAGRRRPRK